jgi:hypothetical protein
LLLVIGIASVEECAQGDIVLAEDGLIKVAADTVAAFAASIELSTVT